MRNGPRVHAAIVMPRCLDHILSGEKTVEARLSLTRREPFERIAEGDTVYFKERGGPYRARAVVGGAEFLAGLEPRDVERLATEYEPSVRGGGEFWWAKRVARYATLIKLTNVQAVQQGPEWVSNGAAWRTFPPAESQAAACRHS